MTEHKYAQEIKKLREEGREVIVEDDETYGIVIGSIPMPNNCLGFTPNQLKDFYDFLKKNCNDDSPKTITETIENIELDEMLEDDEPEYCYFDDEFEELSHFLKSNCNSDSPQIIKDIIQEIAHLPNGDSK